MNDWDVGNVQSQFQNQQAVGGEALRDDVATLRSHLRQFLKTFRVQEHFVYREQLTSNYEQGSYVVEIDCRDLHSFSPELLERLVKEPADVIPVFEMAAKEVVREGLLPQPDLDQLENVQVTLANFERHVELRALQSSHVSTLVCVSGIIVSASRARAKVTSLAVQCQSCKALKTIPASGGFGGTRLPRRCDAKDAGGGAAAAQPQQCPLDPYKIQPESSQYVDQQRLKLQEAPDHVPPGEMPRHLSLSVERYLVDQVKPGTRVTAVGIYSVFTSRDTGKNSTIRHPYVRVLGIVPENEAAELIVRKFRPEDEEEVIELSRLPNLYERISNSIAPAIFGHANIKKAVALQLFGGSRKELHDGMRLRGDINILLLGDPSVAKSQFLKFAVQVAPIGVYTSGKGSSAAGLTASVIRDPATNEFQLEGGALVLADGGLVCIDEFDKMRPQDRVAIHEAMEQQTISIAKAGITTVLNSRTSVLAAANPVFGRYDDMKSPVDNIDFQATILSRFDLIFILRDVRNEEADTRLAKHILNVHTHGDSAVDESQAVEGEIEMSKLKKYIAYARARVHPRLSPAAGRMLSDYYIKVRSEIKQKMGKDASAIPITVRQLEAVVRLSESLARLELSNEANESHVKEAIRLFQFATMQAATAEYGSQAFMTPGAQDKIRRIESQLQRRVPIGGQASVRSLVQELIRNSNHEEAHVLQAIRHLVSRGTLEEVQQRSQIRRVR